MLYFYYNSKFNLKLIFLSKFLLNLYLNELDIFIRRIFEDLVSSISLCYNDLNNFTYNNLNYLIINYMPLKFIRSVKSFLNVKIFITLRDIYIKNSISLELYVFQVRYFYRKLFYTRFLNHFLLGILGTDVLSKLLMHKINDFIKSILRFDLQSVKFCKFDEINLFFLGFNIRFFESNNKYLLTSGLNQNTKYFSKIIARINLHKLKISNLFKTRINSEILSHLVKVMYIKRLDFNFFKERFIWTYIFQLESLRCVQLNKLLGLNEEKLLFSDDIFSDFKINGLTFYTYIKYSFNLYIRKLEIVLRSVVSDFSSLLDESFNSFDSSLNSIVFDLVKILKFYKEKYYVDINIFNFDFRNYSFLKKDCYNLNSFIFKLKILSPFRFLLKKFRILGFIHPLKDNPVGNFRFLMYEDSFIVSEFGYLILSFINWYRCSDNFSKVKLFVEYLRESCVLTLARKHNKSKAWVYGVYTSEFVLFRNVSYKQKFFPSKINIIRLKKKYLFSYFNNCFDEKFFIKN